MPTAALGIPGRQRNAFISAVQVPFISEVVGADGEHCGNYLWRKSKNCSHVLDHVVVSAVVVVMVIDEPVGVVPHCQGNSRLCALALLQICYFAVCLFVCLICFAVFGNNLLSRGDLSSPRV
ncbi:hypothetical protein MKW92_002181 [Papaver armeniacum]|nr:hypothetical protein MKW92_002181 [Papaver armeniacum]